MVPPPYSPFGITPSKVRYSIGWSSVWTESRFSPGTRLGPRELVELFDAHGVSFVSVTQAFNTTSSMGRLTLNVLLSFAQFEREVIGERVRDKISKRKGLWVGGPVPLGYRSHNKKLVIAPEE